MSQISEEIKGKKNIDVDIIVSDCQLYINGSYSIHLINTYEYLMEEIYRELPKIEKRLEREYLVNAGFAGFLTLITYSYIFTNYNMIYEKLLYKGVLSVPILLVIILWIVFIYGFAISSLLKYLGIVPKH